VPNFFRKPFGAGWALVGDAGYHKDPITAQGIADSFRDAELLTEAIDEGFSGRRPLEEALGDYERRRNEAAMPVYELTCQRAALGLPPPEILQLIAALEGNQEQIDRFIGLDAGTVSVSDFFSPENLLSIMTKRGSAA
jgi:flavin-dependent dehydrogenase